MAGTKRIIIDQSDDSFVVETVTVGKKGRAADLAKFLADDTKISLPELPLNTVMYFKDREFEAYLTAFPPGIRPMSFKAAVQNPDGARSQQVSFTGIDAMYPCTVIAYNFIRGELSTEYVSIMAVNTDDPAKITEQTKGIGLWFPNNYFSGNNLFTHACMGGNYHNELRRDARGKGAREQVAFTKKWIDEAEYNSDLDGHRPYIPRFVSNYDYRTIRPTWEGNSAWQNLVNTVAEGRGGPQSKICVQANCIALDYQAADKEAADKLMADFNADCIAKVEEKSRHTLADYITGVKAAYGY